MDIKLASLPPDVRRRILGQTDLKPASGPSRRPRTRTAPGRLMRVCSCRFEIFRPDGLYPERCDGCGCKWAGEA